MLRARERTMKLLELPEGMVSLEFEPSERDGLIRSLKRFGPLKRRPRATHVDISVGGEQFIYENEWDEPCLISTSKGAAAILREVASGAGQSAAA
jgi:hypothetical protein